MEPYTFIEGYEQVTSRFGQWPSFHDGEVLRIVLDRTSRTVSGSYIPTIEVHIRGWVMTRDASEAGLYKLENESVVSFLFEDVFDLDLEGFNHQNVLSSLNLTLNSDSKDNGRILHIELEHCYVFSAEFSARKAKILNVVPYVKASDA
jgi:hypothetical protein